MPIVLRVGYRSVWVDAAAWVQMVLGLLSLLLAAGLMAPLSDSAFSVMGILALVTLGVLLLVSGQALLRRLEWGRRLSWMLIATLLPLLLACPWFVSLSVWLALLLSLAFCIALLWTLNELSSGCVRQEFA
jgi:hypothetical protein